MADKMADGFLPIRVIGSNPDGHEEFIADCPSGTVTQGMTIIDVDTRRPIANLAKVPGTGTANVPIQFVWEVPTLSKFFYYIFQQVMPSDAPKEIEWPDGKKEIVH